MTQLPDDVRATMIQALSAMQRRIVDSQKMGYNHNNYWIPRIDAALQWLQHDAQQPSVQPDWSGAPEWAEWWAASKDGRETWFEHEPVLNDKYTWWLMDWSKGHSKTERVRPRNFGLDWRTCKQRRPQPATAQESSEVE